MTTLIVLALLRAFIKRKGGLARMEEYLAWRGRLDRRIAVRDQKVWNLMAAGAGRYLRNTEGTSATDELVRSFSLPPDVENPEDFVLVLDLTPVQACRLFGVDGVNAQGISEPSRDRSRPTGTWYWVHKNQVHFTVEILCLVAQEPAVLPVGLHFRQIHGAVFVGQVDVPGTDLFIRRLGTRRYEILNFFARGTSLTARVPKLDAADLRA